MIHQIDYNEYFKNIMELLDISGEDKLSLTGELEVDYLTAEKIAQYLEREELMSASYREDEILLWPTEEGRKRWHAANGSRADQHKK